MSRVDSWSVPSFVDMQRRRPAPGTAGMVVDVRQADILDRVDVGL